MKLPLLRASPVLRSITAEGGRFTHHVSRSPRRQSGSAVIVVMALLAIILIYVAGNLRTLTNLGRELKLLERQQIRRLQNASPRTNAPPVFTVSTNSSSRSPTN
jgi:hypothetical protein